MVKKTADIEEAQAALGFARKNLIQAIIPMSHRKAGLPQDCPSAGTGRCIGHAVSMEYLAAFLFIS